MASAIQASSEKCSKCDAILSSSLRYCPTCQSDAGTPNVRLSRTQDNLDALQERFTKAQKKAVSNLCSKEFTELKKAIVNKSGVVITLPVEVAYNLINDPRLMYVNHERLVGAGVRTPASFSDDQQRYAVGGRIFGSYADSICYGALSLTNEGLPTYGQVYCKMRSVTIEDRTTFLEMNSYPFVDAYGSNLPLGYMACWENRHFLVMAKLVDRLSPGQTESDWQAILVESDGQNRQNDNFIEAHIFEVFNMHSIESVESTPGKKLSKVQNLQLDLVISTFSKP